MLADGFVDSTLYPATKYYCWLPALPLDSTPICGDHLMRLSLCLDSFGRVNTVPYMSVIHAVGTALVYNFLSLRICTMLFDPLLSSRLLVLFDIILSDLSSIWFLRLYTPTVLFWKYIPSIRRSTKKQFSKHTLHLITYEPTLNNFQLRN